MPVADGDVLTVRYGDMLRLMHDLRGMGAGNVLASRPPALRRDALVGAAEHFAAAADEDGRTAEQMAVLYLSGRSEEHTSELQSLIGISYAVFCLKKKKKIHESKDQTT